MTSEDRQINEGSSDDCVALGEMRLDDRSAELYVCDDLLIACFNDPPGDVRAQHMYRLTFESDVFLLAAFRLYLDRTGKVPLPEDGPEGDVPLEC